MKILFTTSGNNLDAMLDGRFGRADFFLVVDSTDRTVHVIDNRDNRDAGHGAGVNAAQKVISAGVDAVVSGRFGPKAHAVLQNAGVPMYEAESGTLQDVLDLFLDNKLPRVTIPGNPGIHT